MAEKKFVVDIQLNQNELKRAVIENQGIAPNDPSPRAGQIYYNTVSGSEGINYYKLSAWKRLLDVDDISNFVPTSRTINSKALVTDIILYGTDIAMSSTDGTTVKAAIENRVVKNADITASSAGKTVITYDAKGLVTGGSEIGVDNNSTNYLGFDTSTHKISAKVDSTVTSSSTNLVTSGAVASAIGTALTGAMKYQGTWTATSQTDYSSITLPVSKGYMYAVSGSATIGGVEWNSGDYLVINKDIAAGGTITSADVDKIDNTESSDLVRLSATQTLTNKTIDADNNTISDLTTSNLKSGVLQTSVRAAASASDTAIASEKAIRTELDLKAPLASPAFTGTPTAPTATTGTNTTQVATTAFVQDAISNASLTLAVNNTALTQSGGVCTWTITNTLNNADVICSVREVSTGEEVYCNITYATSTITIKINSSTNIAANTYRAVIIGQKINS